MITIQRVLHGETWRPGYRTASLPKRRPISLSFSLVVIGRRVEYGATVQISLALFTGEVASGGLLVPNSEVVLAPSEANLQVMVFGNELED